MNNRLIKAVNFSLVKESERKIADHISNNDLNFSDETKRLWMKELNIEPPKKDNRTRIEILKDRLKKDLCREQIYRIKREIKQLENDESGTKE